MVSQGSNTMPAYNTLNPPTALYPGDSGLAFTAEQPPSGTLSQQFAIAPGQSGEEPIIGVEVQFSGAPGAFEFDVYESDVDAQAGYLPCPTAVSITTVDATKFKARADIATFVGSFIAIYCKTQNANAVNATVRITRRG